MWLCVSPCLPKRMQTTGLRVRGAPACVPYNAVCVLHPIRVPSLLSPAQSPYVTSLYNFRQIPKQPSMLLRAPRALQRSATHLANRASITPGPTRSYNRKR